VGGVRHDTYLANDLIIRSLEAKIERLTAQVAALEKWRNRAKRVKVKARAPDADVMIKVAPILDRAARMNGCTVAEIVGKCGTKRSSRGRDEVAYECGRLGLTLTLTGGILGGRGRSAVVAMRDRHKARMAKAPE
jgi:hypothetical protein